MKRLIGVCLISLFFASCATNYHLKKHREVSKEGKDYSTVSVNYATTYEHPTLGRLYLILKGNINVYRRLINRTVVDSRGIAKEKTTSIDYVNKEGTEQFLLFEPDNIAPMISDYEPAVTLMNKFKKVQKFRQVNTTINWVLLGGSFAAATKSPEVGGAMALVSVGNMIVNTVRRFKTISLLSDVVFEYNKKK